MKKLLSLSTILVFAFLLIGCSAETTTTTQADLAPTILGVTDKTVEVGSSELDLLEGITVTDDFDTDLISSVIVTGEVDYDTTGDYDITVTVTDSSGNEASETFTVTVTPSADELAALADIEAIDITQDADGNYLLPTSGSVNSSTIIWTTDRPDVITKKGFVIKPGLDADAVTVTLTANVIKNKFRTTVDYTFTVEPNDGVNGVTSSTTLAFEGTSEEYVVAPQEAVEIFFVDEGNLPYIDVETFVNMIDGAIDSELLTYTPIGEDQLRVEYEVEYEDFDGSMVTESFWALIDFTENTFTVSNFSFFENYVASTSSDYGEGLTYVDAYYVDGQGVTIPLGYYNFDITQNEIANNIMIQGGGSEICLVFWLEEVGFDSYGFDMEIENIKYSIKKGYPLIVFQDYSLTKDVFHSRVIIGYNDNKKVLIVHDPWGYDKKNYEISYSLFIDLCKGFSGSGNNLCHTVLITPLYKKSRNLIDPGFGTSSEIKIPPAEEFIH